jgi:hypothetical protein
MSEAKTIQQRVRPVTLRCASPGCAAKAEGAMTFEGDSDQYEIIGPRGWSFKERNAQSTQDVVFGKCPEHSQG